MREPPPAAAALSHSHSHPRPLQHHSAQPTGVPLTSLSGPQLQDMARRQQQQMEAQQQMLMAKEQRLKYLRQQDYKQHQMAAEYERLRRLREKVEAQELKLRKLRALRGQNGNQQQLQQQQPQQRQNVNAAVLADLDSIRGLFNEKEKELSLAVRKVDELTRQLEELRTGRVNNIYPPQVVELERLRRELAYRQQLKEQQNNMIAQQRAQLSMGQEEMGKIDARIIELQERLTRKRLMNQQLASQISAATNAKQAQLRAIQQGMRGKNKNKPVSTVEPFQRHSQDVAAAAAAAAAADTAASQQEDVHGGKINKNVVGHGGGSGGGGSSADLGQTDKYQTLPFGTKFTGGQQQQPQTMTKSQKIEQLKLEKENNNVQFSDDLPPPPPTAANANNTGGGGGACNGPQSNLNYKVDHQGNFRPPPPPVNANEMDVHSSGNKPTSSVAPVFAAPNSAQHHNQSQQLFKRPNDLFSSSPAAPENLNNLVPQSSSTPIGTSASNNNNNEQGNNRASPPESPTKLKPALPPKPKNGGPAPNQQQQQQMQPPPYIPAPPPDNARASQASSSSSSSESVSADDSAITVRTTQHYLPSSNLSVSTHRPEGEEEETSVDDDDMPSPSEEEQQKQAFNASNSSVSISINRRIEMPPAFHFPEDQVPPSDLVAPADFSRDMADNAAMFPMMNQIYKEFDHLSLEEKNQLFAKQGEEDYPVPDIVTDGDSSGPKPKGILSRTAKPTLHGRNVCFDPLALLLDASLEGELDLVMRTASQVSDPSAANDEGITALHNAICAGHYDIVQFLVEFGCDVNAQDSDGWTPLHCAASCNNLPMVRFLVEHGACVFATTLSDHETAAEKCEEDEEGFAGCSEYLYTTQEKLGIGQNGVVYAVFDYERNHGDELSFEDGERLLVLRKGDENEKDWWWARKESADKDEDENESEGYIPRNLLGLCPRVFEREDDHERSSSSGGGGNSRQESPPSTARNGDGNADHQEGQVDSSSSRGTPE